MKIVIALALAAVVCSAPAAAAQPGARTAGAPQAQAAHSENTLDARLEQGLLQALRLDRARQDRAAPSGPAIQAYIQAGYLELKPTVRADYTDYRLLKRPAHLLGHELLLVEEEYMTQYVGCCVNHGVGAVLRLHGDAGALQRFAQDNGCRVSLPFDAKEELSWTGLPLDWPKGDYARLSCRERDALP